MLPSEFLLAIRPRGLYHEDVLELLEQCDIGYEDGVLTSHIEVGHPYPTFGRLASVDFMTPRQAIAFEARLTPGAGRSERFVAGHEIAAAVWRLLHPITEAGPPSTYADQPEEKMALDIAAIKGYGY